MQTYYFDSSACVKRFSSEIGSKWVVTRMRPSAGNLIFVARITGAETIAALARKRKGNRLTSDEATKAINRFLRQFTNVFQKITISDQIVDEAMNYANKHELRGYDAVQLAVAMEVEKKIKIIGGLPLIFVSADNDLNNAALAEGLAVENPNNYP